MFQLKTFSGKQKLIDKTINMRGIVLQCAEGADIHATWHVFCIQY